MPGLVDSKISDAAGNSDVYIASYQIAYQRRPPRGKLAQPLESNRTQQSLKCLFFVLFQMTL